MVIRYLLQKMLSTVDQMHTQYFFVPCDIFKLCPIKFCLKFQFHQAFQMVTNSRDTYV